MKLELPVIIVNFKLYKEATGKRAVELAKIHDRVAKETGASIAIAVAATDLVSVIEAVEIPVLAQHVDPVDFGSNTGHLGVELLQNLGVAGTLLNHAEHQLDDAVLEETLKFCRNFGFLTVTCANTPEKAAEILKWGPDLIAVEPPELIGGDLSVSKAEPEVITSAVELLKQSAVDASSVDGDFSHNSVAEKLLVGAGVKDSEDVRIALELGASGVLLASGVVKAEDPYEVLIDLVSGLNS